MHSDIVILYESKRGSAADAANWIADALPGATLVNLHDEPIPENLAEFETIVVGSGILAGSLYGKIEKFVKKHTDLLLSKDLCLFITHLEEDEGIELDFQSAYKKEILEHARHRQGVGGRLDIRKVNVLLRPLMHMIAKGKGIDVYNHDTLSKEACEEFAAKVAAR